MSIARDIARNHGGDINLHASSMNGTRAIVKVPVEVCLNCQNRVFYSYCLIKLMKFCNCGNRLIDGFVADNLANVISEQTISLGEIRFGPRISKMIKLDNGAMFQPSFGITGVWNFGMENNTATQG